MIKHTTTKDWNDQNTINLIGKTLNSLFDSIENNTCQMNYIEQTDSRRAMNIFFAKGDEATNLIGKLAAELEIKVTQTLDESKQIPLFKEIDIENVKNENVFEFCRVMTNHMQPYFYLKLSDPKNDYSIIVLTDELATTMKETYQEYLTELKNYQEIVKPSLQIKP